MVVAYDLDIAREKNDVGMRKLSDMAKKARLQGYEVIAVSASTEQKANSVKEEFDLPFDFYFCDETALKTIVRSVPGILVLHNGTIVDKQHRSEERRVGKGCSP